MKDKLDQFCKNETWELIYKYEIKPGFQVLGGKWVYKMIRNIDDNITRFNIR